MTATTPNFVDLANRCPIRTTPEEVEAVWLNRDNSNALKNWDTDFVSAVLKLLKPIEMSILDDCAGPDERHWAL